MSFNIELVSTATPIKIQVVNKVITIYFNGEKEDAREARARWIHLDSHIISKFSEFGSEDGIALSYGVHHRKKEHTNIRETTICHAHRDASVFK